MHTHEFARALTELARVLRMGPDVEISSLGEMFQGKFVELDSKQIKVGLSQLVALSSVNKRRWIDLIRNYNFPINIGPRESSRDILGKLLRYLERTPGARERIARTTYEAGMKASPQLLKALDSLLKE